MRSNGGGREVCGKKGAGTRGYIIAISVCNKGRERERRWRKICGEAQMGKYTHVRVGK